MIQAAYIPEVNYVELFPDAATATAPLKPNWTILNHFSNIQSSRSGMILPRLYAVISVFYVVNHTTEYSSWP